MEEKNPGEKNQENSAEGHREDGNLAVLPTSATEDLCPGDTDC